MPAFQVDDVAKADLDNIWDYYDREASEAVADRQLGRLYQRFQLLAEQPFMGVARPEFNRAELRSFVVPSTPFIIFYYPRDYGVEIAHIRHGSQDLANLFE